jgi:hypothetical protein
MHLDAELGELGGDELRRAVFLEAQLGMGVQVVPPGDHVLVQVGDAVVHDCSPRVRRYCRARGRKEKR